MNKQMIKYKSLYPLGEEIANAITHGIGTLLAISALVLLIIRAACQAPIGQTGAYVTGYAIFGSSLILLYCMSTLYHALSCRRAKAVFCKLDHSAIYVLIAGTYTAYCLSVLYGPTGWTLFGVIWFLATIGIVIHSIYGNRDRWFSLVLYLIMGWLVIVFAERLCILLPASSWKFLLYGGISYTFGCLFFVMKGIPWMHAIWHLFVLAGSILHFFSLYYAI